MSEANIPPTSGSPESAPIDPSESLTSDVWQDWQTVDLPNSFNVDAIVPAEPSADEPQATDLIELIQQLNECNTQLLDRVEQLEAAIEHSQTDLQAEITQHQEVIAQAEARETAMQTQMTQLMQQLEFSHQSNQRQQILVETLTEQLENSQERIAQLERECSIAQQRCGEQAQKIVEVENTCRDLQIRLQRQQRYTMQFKVALNKCLEVPAPCYEAEADQAVDREALPERTREALPERTREALPEGYRPVPHALLPKLASIQPWSAQPQFPELDPEETMPQLQRLRSIELSSASNDDLNSTLSEWIDSPDSTSVEAAIDETPDSKVVESSVNPADQIIETIEITPDMLAEPKAIEQAEPKVVETIEITSDMLHDLSDAPATEATPVAADAEDDLWQDLARLIEVSTEDVVRASAAEDFAQFAQRLAAEPDWQSAPTAPEPPAVTPSAEAPAAPELPVTKQPTSVVKSNWPSPIVYPLRPATRKRESLAAVELPSFPR
ncbi:MAG: hypothetical protein F6K28_25620 [Microcoleus sp. SIO2G3]|nr:hypothetical protein [Microcoleus sp. SIO2G3]